MSRSTIPNQHQKGIETRIATFLIYTPTLDGEKSTGQFDPVHAFIETDLVE